jgi:hypothetical protein
MVAHTVISATWEVIGSKIMVPGQPHTKSEILAEKYAKAKKG